MYRFYGAFFCMEMYGIFRVKRKVTVPRAAEYLLGMFSFEYPHVVSSQKYKSYSVTLE